MRSGAYNKPQAVYARWSTWAKANNYKLLKDMPLWYLATMAGLPGLAASLVAPMVPAATKVYLEQLLPVAPWQVSVPVSVWMLAWWAFLGMSALLVATYGKALG